MATFNPGFTGSAVSSGPILSADQIRQQAEATARAQYEREQSNIERQKLLAQQQQDALAKQLVDFYSANPLMWEGVDQYAYGNVLNPSGNRSKDIVNASNVYGQNTPDPTGSYILPQGMGGSDGATQFGSIGGNTGWVPTLDEAKQILEAFGKAPRGDKSNANGYQSAQGVVSGLYGDLPQPFVDYLASQTQFQSPTQDASAWKPNTSFFDDMGIPIPAGKPQSFNPNLQYQEPWSFPTLDPLNAPLMYGNASTKNEARDTFRDFLSAAKIPDAASASTYSKPAWASTFGEQQPTPTYAQFSAPIIGKANDQIAQNQSNSELYTNAYNQFTLGNSYGGGVLDANNMAKYSAPFGGSMPWFDQNNPVASIQGHAGVNGGHDGFGGLGGLGGAPQAQQQSPWGGPWGASNPWAPK